MISAELLDVVVGFCFCLRETTLTQKEKMDVMKPVLLEQLLVGKILPWRVQLCGLQSSLGVVLHCVC